MGERNYMNKEYDILVSIIVPIYNVEKYISQCIESIIDQTYKNIEIVLINDGSLDKSGIIADEYAQKDTRIKVVHKENQGVSIARNVGIERAKGDYICFADADDVLMPDYVEYLLDMAVNNDADIALTKEMYTTFHPEQSDYDLKEIYSAEETTIDILSYNIPIGVYCKMFKKEFLGDAIRFVPEIYIGEGFNFNTTAFQRANKVAIGYKRIYFYRRDNFSSATTNFSVEKWENGIFAINNIKKNMILHSKKLENAWRYAFWHTHCDAYNFMIMAKGKKENIDFYRKCLKVIRNMSQYAFTVKIRPREKFRAVIMFFIPRLIPFLMTIRNKRFFKE